MNTIMKIDMWMTEFPILHSEYLDWTIKMGSAPAKTQNKIKRFLEAIMELANPEWIFENVVIEVNGKRLSFDDCLKYDTEDAIRRINEGAFSAHAENDKLSYTDYGKLEEQERIRKQKVLESQKVQIPEPVPFISPIVPTVSTQQLVLSYASKAEELKKQAQEEGKESFYYHTLPITDTILFAKENLHGHECKCIRDVFIPYLKFFSLSSIDFSGVHIDGIDLSYIDAKIDLSKVYMKSAQGTNLEGVDLSGEEIRGADLTDANLTQTYAVINADNCILIGTVLDETCTVYDSNGVRSKGKKTERKFYLHF